MRPRWDRGWTAVRPRLDRGATAISYWWSQQLRRRMDYSARIRRVAIVSEFARHLHTIKFQNFKTAVVLPRSAFIVQRLWRKMAKYIAWWLIKETNYNKPWHFKKNAKQINVYIQIIELTVHFDNICFVTATVVIYFDWNPFPYLWFETWYILLILLVFKLLVHLSSPKKTNMRFGTQFALRWPIFRKTIE